MIYFDLNVSKVRKKAYTTNFQKCNKATPTIGAALFFYFL